MLKMTKARGAQTITMRLQQRPTVLLKKGAVEMLERLSSKLRKIGRAYEIMKALTAVETNELKAVVLPRSMRQRRAWISRHSPMA
jgi:hypothetical protein